VILYECLTGRPPFRGTTPLETLEQVRIREPDSPSSLDRQIPRDLATICLKCLRKQPEQRYSSAHELGMDLGRFLRGEPVAALPIGVTERLRKWVRRLPAFAGLLTATVLLLVVGGVGAGLQFQQLAASREHRNQTDRDVRGILKPARGALSDAWQAQDLAQLTVALEEGNRAVDVANSGAASEVVRQEALAFRTDAGERLERAKRIGVLLEAVMDVPGTREFSSNQQDTRGRLIALNRSSADEQYAAAFRRWGLDVDRTPEAQVVERLGTELDVVKHKVIVALDGWMIECRLHRQEAESRRLFRIANRLDQSDPRRQLRALLIGELPPSGNARRRVLEARQEIVLSKEPPLTIILLAQAYMAVGDPAAAEDVLRQAIMAQPGDVALLVSVANLLEHKGPSRLEEAIGYYRSARAVDHNFGLALSMALCRAGRAKHGEEVLLELIRQHPDNPSCWDDLGYALAEQSRFAEAEAAVRKAIILDPDYANAQNSLGNTLYLQKQYAEAEAAYRKAIVLAPDDPAAYSNLGAVLNVLGRHVEAEAAARKAVDLKPDCTSAYNDLGVALQGQKQYAAAEKAFMKAIALGPNLADFHANLGSVLVDRKKYAAAEAALTKAIALQPTSDEYAHLGISLTSQQKHAQAEAAFQKAIALQPDSSKARFYLGFELIQQARFQEAAATLKEADSLLPAKNPIREQLHELQQECQRNLNLLARLPAILRGTDKPMSAIEQSDLVELCARKKLYAAAAHFYADALRDPKLKADVEEPRYDAACAAAHAGCGQGDDANTTNDKDRTRLRRQAFDWLREDLAAQAKELNNTTAPPSDTQVQRLRNWQIDPDLDCVRNTDALIRLPDEERHRWQSLWSDVDALLRRVGGAE
jgi:serine/threonine-protein kinase